MVNGLHINGDFVSGEIQMLAPGRGNMTYRAAPSNYGHPSLTSGLSWQDTSTPNARGDMMNGFYLNFDFRLRNGGLGFNLIDTSTGDRIVFVRSYTGNSRSRSATRGRR